jgi:hypothetical protein
MAVVLVGIMVVPILNAVITGIKASSISRSSAQAETALVNAADRVNRAPKRCDYSIYAQAAVQTQGWSADRVALTQEYFVPGASPAVSGTWRPGSAATPACQIDTVTDGLVQRVTIAITTPDGKVTRRIQVVKSDV